MKKDNLLKILSAAGILMTGGITLAIAQSPVISVQPEGKVPPPSPPGSVKPPLPQ